MKALLIIAHGSRQEEANADLHHVVAMMRQREEYAIVEPAFLELTEPTIEHGGERCVALGARQVILLPYFLSAGMHVRRDLEEHRRRLAEQHAHVTFLLAEPLGRHPFLLGLLAQRARETDELLDGPRSLRGPAEHSGDDMANP